VGYVEKPGLFPDRQVFGDKALPILHGQEITREGDHLSAMRYMPLIKGSFLFQISLFQENRCLPSRYTPPEPIPAAKPPLRFRYALRSLPERFFPGKPELAAGKLPLRCYDVCILNPQLFGVSSRSGTFA
jgi:hypothetical protein